MVCLLNISDVFYSLLCNSDMMLTSANFLAISDFSKIVKNGTNINKHKNFPMDIFYFYCKNRNKRT